MQLKEFISEVLVEICEGVLDAKDKTVLAIAPGTLNDNDIESEQAVNFDILVNVSSADAVESGGKGKINVFAMSGDVSRTAKRSSETNTQHRIQFSVPVYFQAKITNRRA